MILKTPGQSETIRKIEQIHGKMLHTLKCGMHDEKTANNFRLELADILETIKADTADLESHLRRLVMYKMTNNL